VISLQDFLKNGRYLPPNLRDFHVQKKLFKRIEEVSDLYDWRYMERPKFQPVMCYTIDLFLWFMAKHGYTLQKTRASVDGLQDLDGTMAEFEQREMAASSAFFAAAVAELKAKREEVSDRA
jgi:hypothetical protein